MLFIILYLLIILCNQCILEVIPIGALFANDIDAYNFKTKLLNYSIIQPINGYEFQSIVKTLDKDDAFFVTKEVCSLLNHGVFGIVVGSTISSLDSIFAYSDRFKIPLINTNDFTYHKKSGFIVNIRPNFIEAIAETIKYYSWHDIIYLYKSPIGLKKLEALLSLMKNYPLHVSHILQIQNGDDAYKILSSLEQSNPFLIKHIVLDCDLDTTMEIIVKHVDDIYMGKRNYHYLFANLIMDNIASSKLLQLKALNFTGFSLMRPQISYRLPNDFLISHNDLDPQKNISMDLAFTLDSINVLFDTLKRLLDTRPLTFRDKMWNNGAKNKKHCNNESASFEHGALIGQYILETNIKGITGDISFDENGFRKNYQINIIEKSLFREAINIAKWSLENGFQAISNGSSSDIIQRKHNKTFIVTCILEEPFLMKKDADEFKVLRGNDRFVGYVKDLADILFERLGYKYELKLVDDGSYGINSAYAPTEWTGMIGELIRMQADVAIAALTITSKRSKVVHFSQPIMHAGISLMMRKPSSSPSKVFNFFGTFSGYLWLAIILSYLSVLTVYCIIRKLTTVNVEENKNIEKNIPETDPFWLPLLEVLNLNLLLKHRCISASILGIFWWLFCLIIIASYTASIILREDKNIKQISINSIEDLVKQNEIEYGAIKKSSTSLFFQQSRLDIYSRMWNIMNSRKDVMVNSIKEGVEKVRKSDGKYAFLLESPSNEYINERKPCDTMKVGNNIDFKGYGIATALKSPYSEAIDFEVLRLKETGILEILKKKWWRSGSECSEYSNESKFTLDNLSGCFYLLIIGLFTTLLFALGEKMIKARLKCKKIDIKSETLPDIDVDIRKEHC